MKNTFVLAPVSCVWNKRRIQSWLLSYVFRLVFLTLTLRRKTIQRPLHTHMRFWGKTEVILRKFGQTSVVPKLFDFLPWITKWDVKRNCYLCYSFPYNESEWRSQMSSRIFSELWLKVWLFKHRYQISIHLKNKVVISCPSGEHSSTVECGFASVTKQKERKWKWVLKLKQFFLSFLVLFVPFIQLWLFWVKKIIIIKKVEFYLYILFYFYLK